MIENIVVVIVLIVASSRSQIDNKFESMYIFVPDRIDRNLENL